MENCGEAIMSSLKICHFLVIVVSRVLRKAELI